MPTHRWGIKRRSLLLAAVLSGSLARAHAAQKYSFSNLAWGDNRDQAEQKIKAAGYSLDKYFEFDKTKGRFVVAFKGVISDLPFTGSAQFIDSRLVGVRLRFVPDPMSVGKQIQEIESLVKRKYGKGRYLEKGRDGSIRTKYGWGYSPDETLEITVLDSRELKARVVEIEYSSPTINRLAQQVKAADEASQRKKRIDDDAKKAKESAKF